MLISLTSPSLLVFFNSRQQAWLHGSHSRCGSTFQGALALNEMRAAGSPGDFSIFCLFLFTGCRVGFELPVHCKFSVG